MARRLNTASKRRRPAPVTVTLPDGSEETRPNKEFRAPPIAHGKNRRARRKRAAVRNAKRVTISIERDRAEARAREQAEAAQRQMRDAYLARRADPPTSQP